jgi:hypothetical protein
VRRVQGGDEVLSLLGDRVSTSFLTDVAATPEIVDGRVGRVKRETAYVGRLAYRGGAGFRRQRRGFVIIALGESIAAAGATAARAGLARTSAPLGIAEVSN